MGDGLASNLKTSDNWTQATATNIVCDRFDVGKPVAGFPTRRDQELPTVIQISALFAPFGHRVGRLTATMSA